MMIAPTYKHIFRPYIVWCETLNTHSRQELDIWSMEIKGGWPNSKNLIAGDAPDVKQGYDTMLRSVV